jgi:hypothetical protein
MPFNGGGAGNEVLDSAGQSLFHRTNVRGHELPSPFLFDPHMGRLKLAAVLLILFFASPS